MKLDWDPDEYLDEDLSVKLENRSEAIKFKTRSPTQDQIIRELLRSPAPSLRLLIGRVGLRGYQEKTIRKHIWNLLDLGILRVTRRKGAKNQYSLEI